MRGSGDPHERASAAGAPRRADLIALAILAALITILFLDVLLGINSLFVRDLSHYYYPAKHVVRDIVLGGELPSWNPFFSAGQPLAANPEHEVFYPLTWLILLPRFDLAFHLLILLHLYIAALAMYAFLRSLELRPTAAFFGALSFTLGGIGLSYLNLLPCLFAVAWLPLICLFARRFLLFRSRRDFAWASFFFAVQLLVGEPATILQTGILLGLYALWVPGRMPGAAARPPQRVALIGLVSLAAFLLAAVQMLPAIDHLGDSVRARGLPFEVVTSWSMPPARLAEIVHPNLFGHQMHDGKRLYWGGRLYPGRGTPFLYGVYPGLLMTTLLMAGFIARVRGAGLTAIVLAVSIALALGAHTPLWQLLYAFGVRSLRYPEKYLVMGLFAAIAFATIVLDRLLSGDARVRRASLISLSVITIATGAIAAFALTPSYARIFVAMWGVPERALQEMLAASRSGWILAAARDVLLLVLLGALARIRRTVWLAFLGIFVVIDLGMLLPELAPRVPSSYYREPPQLARQLPADRAPWRLLHLAQWQTRGAGWYFAPQKDLYWIHRNAMYPPMPAAWGIRTVLDVDFDRTALLPTADFTDAIGALSQKREDWMDVAASMSNAWFVGEFVPAQEEFRRVNEDRRILQPVRAITLEPYPRYFFADQVETIRSHEDFVDKLASRRSGERTAFIAGASFRPAPGIVRSVQETANTAVLEVENSGRAFLFISVTPHKYWRVTVDGRETEAIVTNVGYQGVVIPERGRHVVEMRYRNPLFAAGGAISLATALGLFLIARAPARPASPRLAPG